VCTASDITPNISAGKIDLDKRRSDSSPVIVSKIELTVESNREEAKTSFKG